MGHWVGAQQTLHMLSSPRQQCDSRQPAELRLGGQYSITCRWCGNPVHSRASETHQDSTQHAVNSQLALPGTQHKASVMSHMARILSTHPAVIHKRFQSSQIRPFGGFENLGGPALPAGSVPHPHLLQRIYQSCPAVPPIPQAGLSQKRQNAPHPCTKQTWLWSCAPCDNAEFREALLRGCEHLHGVAARHLNQCSSVHIQQDIIQVHRAASAQDLVQTKHCRL